MNSETIDREVVDVLIAGGSVAGVAAAAALSQLGLNVLIIEPGPAHGRRLAGELIHPPGIDGLCELGLLDRDLPLGSEVKGFAIFPSNLGADAECMILPYGEAEGKQPSGLAIEHTLLKERLLERVQQFPGVSAKIGARVTALEGDGPFTAVVSSAEGDERIEARLILGADGPMSQMRKMAGISHETQRYSGMMGVEVDDSYLPHHGYGNIFLNPVGVAYAYAIGDGRARIMFEVLRDADPKDSIKTHLSFFPEVLRNAVEQNLTENKPLAAANYCIIPETSIKSNFALVGDARGCCHPLTASGITAAVKDALILRDSLRETKRDGQFDFTAGLRRFSRICGRLQLTRRTLAEELREAFLAQTPADLLLNQCIFSYWRNSKSGRVHSMALLSMLDSSIFSLAAQYLLVVLHVFRLLPHWVKEKKLSSWLNGVFKLFIKSLEFQQTAITQWLKA
ncbi:MAG: NAD(P)/FAD-dependent oxidoreductase [Proteobacteria bacterium]|nr:NAD(P)/FAD-dependent oxidoreductase [Pseudomonadota bacterium]